MTVTHLRKILNKLPSKYNSYVVCIPGDTEGIAEEVVQCAFYTKGKTLLMSNVIVEGNSGALDDIADMIR